MFWFVFWSNRHRGSSICIDQRCPWYTEFMDLSLKLQLSILLKCFLPANHICAVKYLLCSSSVFLFLFFPFSFFLCENISFVHMYQIQKEICEITSHFISTIKFSTLDWVSPLFYVRCIYPRCWQLAVEWLVNRVQTMCKWL